MKTKLPGTLVVIVALFFAVQKPAVAQSDAEYVKAFAGQWQDFDDVYAVGGKHCQIDLKTTAKGGDYELTTTSCGLELGELTAWRIADKHLALLAGTNPVVLLGGNQHRISGDSSIGAPIVLDRVGDKGFMDQLEAARKATGCYYLGFTATCADDSQLAKPTVPSDGTGARVDVLVNLTARAEARDDASVIGVVKANTCVVTDACVNTADGVWCRATFKDRVGWLRKLALRQKKWAVVTFVNQCAKQ